jgi:hypothetical protein
MSRLEKITNIAVLVTCVLVVAQVGRNYYLSHQLAARARPEGVKKGQVIALPGDAVPGAPATLVLALSTHCHFCQASVPFYQKLSAWKKNAASPLRLVAVLPEAHAEAAEYLRGHGIVVDAVLSMPVSQMHVQGTPTLLLLDERKRVEEVWVGQLQPEKEADVLARLKKEIKPRI